MDEANKLLRYEKSRRNSATFLELKAKFGKLFDICSYKCVGKKITYRNACTCKTKVPAANWQFWLDQKTERKMFIGPVDVKSTKKIKTRLTRQESRDISRKKQKQTFVEELSEDSQSSSLEEESEVSIDSQQSADFEFSFVKYQNTFQNKEPSQIMERTGVSNRDACKIVNVCMKNMRFVSPTYLLDRAKVKRQRKHWREISAEEHAIALSGLSCLGFDGRIDITRSLLDKESYTKLEFIKEDHYVIVSYPGNVYMHHVAPQTGRLADITKELISIVREKNSDKTLTAIVYDGTKVNIGYKHGVIRSL